MNIVTEGILLLEIEEVGVKGSMPFLLSVLRFSECSFITEEVFAVGLRDISKRYMRSKEVRWRKSTMVRFGENVSSPKFRIRRIIDRVEDLKDAGFYLK